MDRSNLSSPTQKYVCEYDGCSMSFSRPNRLEIHVRTHTGERPYVCDYEDCKKSYVRKMHLDRHIDTAHSKKTELLHHCTFDGCTKYFASKCGLNKHIKSSHQDPNNYRCPVEGCGKAFHKKHQLRAHGFEHSGVLPFQCDVEGCNKQFTQTSHLQRHKKIHTLYECDEEGCSKKFEKWSLLRKHKAIAHATKHACKICRKSFPRPILLSKHMEIHATDCLQMFKCPQDNCSRIYSEAKNLRMHIRSYHEGKKLKCDDCGQEVVNKAKLRQHLKLHQRKDNSTEVKSYPNKGHRRKAVPVKVVDHILNIISPVDFTDIRDVAPREGELDAKSAGNHEKQTHADPTNISVKTEIKEEFSDVEKFLKQAVENSTTCTLGETGVKSDVMEETYLPQDIEDSLASCEMESEDCHSVKIIRNS